MAEQQISYCSVFPKIGIARVGDSKDFFVGPEAPGVPADPSGGFKDEHGFVKRQAARFRVFGFDAEGNVIKELTAENTQSINWRVSLANKKAIWHEFQGAAAALALFEGRAPKTPVPLRNSDWPGDRRELVMKAGAAIAGTNQTSPPFLCAIYQQPKPVYLGELRTDEHGRLVVLGGHGHSQAIADDDAHLITHYANNDGWYDDTADGPVGVEVVLSDGTPVPVKGRSWVVVAPPDFSPHTDNLVTLYDVMEEVALQQNLPWHPAAVRPPAKRTRVSFLEDIYPLLCRIVDYQWVSERALRGHGPGKKANFLDDSLLGPLANEKDKDGAALRQHIFSLIRNPSLTGKAAADQATLFYMPQLAGDEGDPETGTPDTWLKVTERQYEALRLWSENNFIGFPSLKELKSAIKPAKRLDELSVPEQPFALTKGALTPCVGGPFYPGIEITSVSQSKKLYAAAFEIADSLEGGDITKWMALPWQADFFECNTHWWPAQRPDDVVSEFDYQEAASKFDLEKDAHAIATLLFPRKEWARGVTLGRALRPTFDWPEPLPGETTEALAKRARDAFKHFTRERRDTRWRIPGPRDGEALGRYQFRLREFFDHYSGQAVGHEHWRFELPVPESVESTSDYQKRTRSSFTEFIDTLVPIPTAGEAPDQYLARLNQSDSPCSGFIASTTQVGYEFRQDKVGDNQMVHKWKELGFVVPVSNIQERILVEKWRPKYAGLRDRDYFYIMLNLPEFPDFEDTARKLVRRFLHDAKAIQRTKQFQSDPDQRIWEFFKYTPSAFEARMSQIYNQLSAEGEKYNPDSDKLTKENLVARILQLAPFNQLDGAWLRYATDAGPIADVNSFLFEIWSDETGNGDPALNHANLYTALLQSQGIYLPDLRSRAYADNPDLFDSAFTGALFELVISLFSNEFFPEILGMTMQLEWEVLSLWPGVKRLESHQINAQFYRMHIGIDNADNGHGAKAKMAVRQYLDWVEKESGPDEVQRQWERIWTGYVAFATTGDVANDLSIQRDYPPTIEQKMLALVERKRRFAELNHSNLPPFGANRMNDWFEDPEGLLEQLSNSKYITPGDPDNSTLLNDRTTYRGPMYKVFTPAELKLWADWIRWLGKVYGAAPTAPPDPGALMKQLIEKMASSAMNVAAHQSRQLTGTLSGRRVTQSVAEWFKSGSISLMSALQDTANNWITPNSSGTSRFFTELLPSAPAMSDALDNAIVGGKTGTTVVREWVDAGCPIPGAAPSPALMAVEGEAMLLPTKGASRVVSIADIQPSPRRRPLYRKQIFGPEAVH